MTLHADALTTLRGWTAPSPAQESLRARYVAHLEQHSDGLERSCFPRHLTAGTVVLSADGADVLLNLHRKARRWFHFGGHCEPGDATLGGAALREAREESGLAELVFHDEPVHLDVHAVEFCDPRGTVQHLDVRYAALAAPGARHEVSEESLDVRWWPVSRLPDGVEDELVTLIGLASERLATR